MRVLPPLVLALIFQPVLAATECVPTIAGKDEVVITTNDGRRFKGVLACVEADKVTLTSGGTTRMVPRSVIQEIVTARDSVVDGFVIGAAIGAAIIILGSYEAHLREGNHTRSSAATILGLGGVGALVDAARHTGGRRVWLPVLGVREPEDRRPPASIQDARSTIPTSPPCFVSRARTFAACCSARPR